MPHPSVAKLHPHLSRVGIDRSPNASTQFPENYTGIPIDGLPYHEASIRRIYCNHLSESSVGKPFSFLERNIQYSNTSYQKLLLLISCTCAPRVMADQLFCQDRVGLLRYDTFKFFSCSMCYLFLFQKTNTPMKPQGSLLVFKNDSGYGKAGSYVIPDIRNESIRQVVCADLSAYDCARWTDCCEAAIDCCDSQHSHTSWNGNNSYVSTPCPQTWDGYACWGATTHGIRASLSCPYYIKHAEPTELAYKDCTINGTWWRHPLTNKEWTNYSSCIPNKSIRQLELVSYVGVTSSAVSVILLIPAIAIFATFRPLYSQQRIKLHLNLFASFVVTGLAFILWQILVHQDRMHNPAKLTRMYMNTPGCKLLYILLRYARSVNFFMMFAEGFYLHRLIVNTFEAAKYMFGYYIFGWLLSFIPVLIYSIIRVVHADVSCWIFHIGGAEWIIYTPNLLCLLVNVFFLVRILHILLTQLQSHPNEPSNYRRGLKATFILVPLFGIQLVLVIYSPPELSDANLPYAVLSTIVINSQGGLIALVFCFFNGEVHSQLKMAYRRWRYAGDSGRDYSKNTQSYTACSQLTTDCNGHQDSGDMGQSFQTQQSLTSGDVDNSCEMNEFKNR